MPTPYIPRERVQQAIRLTEFFLSQVTLIHSEGSAALGEGGLTPRISAILGKLKQFGSLTAGKLQAAISWLRKVSPTKLRQELMELAKLGYGTLVGKGNRLKLVWNQKTTDTADSTTDKTTDSADSLQTLDLREFQELEQLTTDTTDIGSILSSGEGSSDEVGSINTSPDQQYQQISSSPPDLDKSSVPAPDTVSVGESVDSLTAVSNPDDNGDDPDDDPPGGSPDDDPPGGSPVAPTYSPQGDDDGGNDVTDESATANTGATEPSGNDGGELLTASEMADWHKRLNACQSFDDASEFYTALDTLSPSQRQQFDSSVPPERWNWLFALPEVQDPVTPEPEPESVPLEPESVPESLESESVSEPTLEELKALLLACNTLTALNELKRKHKKTVGKAYRSMTETEQSHIDALRALAVPHKVFKYLGDEIRLGSERLIKGTLVYVDPQVQVRSSTRSAGVWAINGVASGWVRPIEVSFSQLKEVVKFVLQDYQERGQQMGLY